MQEVQEIWKDIAGFEGKYQISNLGNIKSLKRIKHRNKYGPIVVPEKILNPRVDNIGYKRLYIYGDGFKKRDSIHRFVANAFIPNPENKPEVNHKNGIKTDNRVENLEWVTVSENRIHAFKNKLQVSLKGSQSPNSILTESDVLEIRKLWGTKKFLKKELASKYNVSRTSIYLVVSNKSWRHV
jgi:hypothetical protein